MGEWKWRVTRVIAQEAPGFHRLSQILRRRAAGLTTLYSRRLAGGDGQCGLLMDDKRDVLIMATGKAAKSDGQEIHR